MDWETYEEVTKNIYETLGKQASVKIVGHGRKFKVTGKSSVKHQIDVLTSHSDGIHDYITAIECKDWNKKINKDIVMKMEGIVKDCNFNKGIIVTKKGVTPDGVKYAEFANIGLVILREPTEEDLRDRTKKIIIIAHNQAAHITKFVNNDVEVYKNLSGLIQTDRYFYIFKNGEKRTLQDYFSDFEAKLLRENILEETTEEINFNCPVLFQDIHGNKIAKVIGLKLSGKVDVTTSRTELLDENKIWLMMKSIFEDKTFAVFENGEIRDIS
jgi:hypothetical protein